MVLNFGSFIELEQPKQFELKLVADIQHKPQRQLRCFKWLIPPLHFAALTLQTLCLCVFPCGHDDGNIKDLLIVDKLPDYKAQPNKTLHQY